MKIQLHIAICVFVLSVTAGAQALGAEINLAWDPNPEPDLEGYLVYRSQESGKGYQPLLTSPIASPAYTDTGVQSGVTYYYVVSAVNQYGEESPYSNEVKVELNGIPQVNAGPDLTVNKGILVILGGSYVEPDNDPVQFKWTQISGPLVQLTGVNQLKAQFIAPVLALPGTLVFELEVTDSKGARATDRTTVQVLPNQTPSLQPFAAMQVDALAGVTLTAQAADGDGDPLVFQWSQVSGVPVALQGASKASVSFTAPHVTVKTELVFKITVGDGYASSSAQAVVNVQPAQPLVFPLELAADLAAFRNTFVGIAVYNDSQQQNQLRLFGSDGGGDEVVVSEGSILLEGQGQTSFLGTEVTDPAADSTTLKVQGDSGPVRGFFMVGKNDLTRLDGIGGFWEASNLLYFPLGSQTRTEQSFLYFYNPTVQPVDVQLQVSDDKGLLIREAKRTVAPGGTLAGLLSDLLGTEIDLPAGYLTARSTGAVKGFELHAGADDFTASKGRHPVARKTLMSPHFFVDGSGGDTQLRLLNVSDKSAAVTVTARDEAGFEIGEAELSVAAGSLVHRSVGQLLQIGSPGSTQLHTGILEIQVSDGSGNSGALPPEMLGEVTFSANKGRYVSTLPLASAGSRKTRFLHVAQSPAWEMFTGLAVYNPGSVGADVTVRVFDERGRLSAEKSLRIDARQRLLGLLDDAHLFGASFHQIRGHIEVTASEPVVSFALFGNSQMKFLAAIEGQE